MPPDSQDGTAPDVDDISHTLDRSLDLVRFLRANCDWDAAQTPDSLLPYLLEEAHETAEAIVARDDADLNDELGDLLLNVAFQIVLAEERGAFTAGSVVGALESKMRRRHPHLYGDGPRIDWDTLKRTERDAKQPDRPESILDGIASGLEPLARAQRIQERVAYVGFDWPDASGALDKIREEVDEVAAHIDRPGSADLEEEIGDLLFAVVNVARLSGVHAMRALIRANMKFSSRFRALEELAGARGIELGVARLEELEELWQEVKRLEQGEG